MGVVGRLDQYASMLAYEFDDYSMSENLVSYSTYNASTWGSYFPANATITTGISAPDGTSTAIRFTCTATGNSLLRVLFPAFTPNGTDTYTSSFYVRLISGTTGGLSSDLNDGAPNGSYLSSLVSNQWVRVSFSGVPTATSKSFIDLLSDSTNNYVLDFWGVQVEKGSVATDYTPTTTTAISRILPATTNTNITGLGTYYSSGFDENVGFTTFLSANIFAPYDLVYDEFSGTLFGAGQGRYMRQNTDKSVIVYNEIDEVSDFRDIVRTGLVLDLDAAQPLSYSGTGTTWTDLSGIGNNGTLVNTPTYNTANSGYFDFDYTQSESVTFASASSLQFLNRLPYTLEAWVYPTRNPGASNWTGIFDREDTSIGSRDGYNLYFLGSATTDTFFTTERFVAGTNSSNLVTLNQSVSVNAWQHIVATYDGTTLTLYRNGSAVGTPVASTGNITNTSKALTIGVRGGQYFGGRIANAKIYSTSLTSTQILQNYNALRNRFGL